MARYELACLDSTVLRTLCALPPIDTSPNQCVTKWRHRSWTAPVIWSWLGMTSRHAYLHLDAYHKRYPA